MALKESRKGRPRLNRQRHVFLPNIELDVLNELHAQADSVHMKTGPYLELLISEAHEYHGEYLQTLAQLPTPITADELRGRTAELDDQDMRAPVAPTRSWPVRVDLVLAEQIDARCRELDAAYASYLRAIFREATGRSDRPQHEQVAAEFDSRRGEVTLPEAG